MKDLILKTAFNRVFTTAFYKTLMDLQLHYILDLRKMQKIQKSHKGIAKDTIMLRAVQKILHIDLKVVSLIDPLHQKTRDILREWPLKYGLFGKRSKAFRFYEFFGLFPYFLSSFHSIFENSRIIQKLLLPKFIAIL